jgi:hypothetical protein
LRRIMASHPLPRTCAPPPPLVPPDAPPLQPSPSGKKPSWTSALCFWPTARSQRRTCKGNEIMRVNMFSHGNTSAGERAEAPKGHSLRALPKNPRPGIAVAPTSARNQCLGGGLLTVPRPVISGSNSLVQAPVSPVCRGDQARQKEDAQPSQHCFRPGFLDRLDPH